MNLNEFFSKNHLANLTLYLENNFNDRQKDNRIERKYE